MATQEEVDNLFKSPLPNPPTDTSTMNPQERFLYDFHQQNLAQPEAANPDGTHSSLLATTMSFGDKTYLLPSIYKGVRYDKPEDIEAHAREVGLDNFPSYASPEEADKRYLAMGGLHDRMEQDQPDQAGAAANVRDELEKQAQLRRAHAITAIQRSEGIGMEQPNFHAEGPQAFEAEQELAKIRGKSPIYRANPWALLPNYWENYANARAQGYTREEIDQHTQQMIGEAQKQGYSNDEINLYLQGVTPRTYTGAEKPNPTMGKAGAWLRQQQDDIFGPHGSNYAPQMGLPTPGAMTGGALWKQLGWNMWDAAKVFPGGLVGSVAAMAELGDGSDRTDGEQVKLLWEASQLPMALLPFLGKFGKVARAAPHIGPLEGEILPPEPRGGPLAPRSSPIIEGEYRVAGQEVTPAQGFPKFHDFMDAATNFAQKHPDGYDPANLPVILRQLGDHFIASGDHPLETAGAHPTYDSFLLRLEDLRKTGSGPAVEDSVARTPTKPGLPVPMDVVKAGSFADAFTQRLANGEFDNLSHDSILDHIATTFKQLMADESGAIKWPFWRTDIKPDEMFRPDPLRYGEVVDNVRAIFSPASMSPRLAGQAKSLMAWSALETERVIHGLSQYGRYVAELSDPMRVQMIAAYQRGLLPVIEGNRRAFERQYPLGTPMRTMADAYLKPGSPLFGFFKEMQFHSDQAWKQMDQLGVAPGYVFNYFPGQWKEMEAARAFVGRGKLGNSGRSFRKEKELPDIEAGIMAGLTPVSTNPIQVMAARLASQQKWIRDWQVFRQFENDGAVLPEDMVTPDMKRDGWTPAPQYFSLPGQNVGQKWVHPDAARLLSSMTDSGFAKFSLYRLLRTAANFVTSVNLAGPGFHSTFVTLDAMSTDLALGMQEMSRALFNPTKGLWGEAAQGALSMLRSPLAPLLNARAGAAMHMLAKNPGINRPTILGLPTTAVSDALKAYMEGGGRFGLEDIYKSSPRQGSFWKGLKAQFMPSDGHMTFTQEIAEMARDTYGDVRVGGALKIPAWTALMTGRLLARFGDTLSAPLMGFYVPGLKAGTFYRHMQSAMRVAPNMGPLEVQRVAGNISSMIDNRFGEMVYDNKFWNSYAKTAGQLAFRAMGFNYGALDTIAVGSKEIGKAIIGRPDRLAVPKYNPTTKMMEDTEIKQFGSKASALIGMAMFTALAGAFIMGLEGTLDDKSWTPYDLLYPKLANGTRIKLPSHMNNAYEFYNHPGESFRNRVNGMWIMGYDQLRNTQWDDRTPITPPSHESKSGAAKSWTNEQALEDRFNYWQHGMWPYSLQQYLNPTEAQGEIDPTLRMLGVGPAPWEIRAPDKAKRFNAKQAQDRQRAWDYQQRKKRDLERKRGQ